jgi:hypothetical protein
MEFGACEEGFEPYQSRAANEVSEHVWVRFKSRPTHFWRGHFTSAEFHLGAPLAAPAIVIGI